MPPSAGRNKIKAGVSFHAFVLELTTSNGLTTGERTFVSNGVTARQVLKDGQWVNVDPPSPPQAKLVHSKVVKRKA
jgi:hypothetical protein